MAEPATAETIRQKVFTESAGRCCMCAAHTSFQVEVAPMVPLSEGGEYVAGNLAVLCAFCRWLLSRQKVTPGQLKARKKQWLGELRRAPREYHEGGLTIVGHPLRLEGVHHGLTTVLEGSELTTLLTNFFTCLDTFLVHEDQHMENAISLAVIRAFRDQYNYVPPEQDIKNQATADSRKLDLLYRSIRALLSAGLATRPAAKTPDQPAATKTRAKSSAGKPPAKPAKPAAKSGKNRTTPAKKSRRAPAATKALRSPSRKSLAAARKPPSKRR